MEKQAYGFGCTLNESMDESVRKVTDALKQEGFGVLTTIDVKATMKTKLDVDVRPYVILGACNPHLAYRGLQAEPELGLLLPCIVIVYDNGDGSSQVSIVDPQQMLGVVQNAELVAVADEAASRLHRVVEHLQG